MIKSREKPSLNSVSASSYDRLPLFYIKPPGKNYLHFLDSLFCVSVTSQKLFYYCTEISVRSQMEKVFILLD